MYIIIELPICILRYMEECVIDKDKTIFETLNEIKLKNFGDAQQIIQASRVKT